MEELIIFIITFIFIFLFYELFLVFPLKKKKNKKELLEISYLKTKYNLDLKKISYNKLLHVCSLVSCLDITIMVTIISYIDSYIWKIVVGIVCSLLLVIISYHLVYLFYKKKGMVLDGKHK